MQFRVFSGLVIGWWSKLQAAPPYPTQSWVPPFKKVHHVANLILTSMQLLISFLLLVYRSPDIDVSTTDHMLTVVISHTFWIVHKWHKPTKSPSEVWIIEFVCSRPFIVCLRISDEFVLHPKYQVFLGMSYIFFKNNGKSSLLLWQMYETWLIFNISI